MSGSGYYNYYNQQPAGSYYSEANPQTWGSAWPMHQQQHQHYAAPPAGYSRSPNNLHSPSSSTSPGQSSLYSQLRTHQQYHNSAAPPNSSPRGYQQRRYSNSSYDNDHLSQNGYGNRQQQNWPRYPKYKRTRTESETLEPKSRTSKKKKKPLSQNNPTKKEWTLQEAEMALKVERELNKRDNQSLLIKFPDLELSKEIVAKFHPAIEDVKFHQPYAARSCFVTLTESANSDAVISELSKQKIGDGHITAEYKKDNNRKDGEDYQNVGPEDIDPTTLYVGNLANNVTVEDIIRIFPKGRRKDVGFARKMKNTRYAFVCFHTVADAIEALKKTHNTDLHCKSLIVRFRRLTNSSDEGRQQNANKAPVQEAANEVNGGSTAAVEHQQVVEEANPPLQELARPCNESVESSGALPPRPQRNELEDSDLEAGNVQSEPLFDHRPKVKTEVKREPEEDGGVLRLKQEPMEVAEDGASVAEEVRKEQSVICGGERSSVIVKSEPEQIFPVDGKDVVVKEEPRENSDSDDAGCLDDGGALGVKSFDSLYMSMREDTSDVQKK